MYSIASWSPSQSEPLIVSYMCQSQLSSDMLPSEAAMPPCAATVCERVGNTFDSTATFSPASDIASAARMPEPPAPTTTTSKVRFATVITAPLHAPQNLNGPDHIHQQRQNHRDVQQQARPCGLDVVH